MLPWAGSILHSFFGVAVDDKTAKLEEHVNTIEAWARNRGTLINKVLNRVNEHGDLSHSLTIAINKLTVAVKQSENIINEFLIISESSL